MLTLWLLLTACAPKDETPPPDDTESDTVADTPGDTDEEEDDPADDPANDALNELNDASETPIQMRVEHGVPVAVMQRTPAPGADGWEAAFDHLQAHGELYGIDDVRVQYHPRAIVEDDGLTHVRLRQRSRPEHGGLPAFNAGLAVHLADGMVYLVQGRHLPELVPDPPILTAADAVTDVPFSVGILELQFHGEPRLGVWVDWDAEGGPKPHTVWRFSVTGRRADDASVLHWQVDRDARTGEVLRELSTRSDCDKDFDIMNGHHEDGASSCWFWVDTDDWFDEDGELDDYSPTADHNDDGQRAFDNAHIVFNWYRDQVNTCSYDDDEAEVEMIVHANIDNASASGFCGAMQFRDNFPQLDIVAHEFTHLVDYNHGDLEYEGQSGALDESFADVFACLIDGNWTIAEDMTNGAFRDLSDPPRFGDPDHMQGTQSGDGIGLRNTSSSTDNGFVHVNSGIPNKAAWLTIVGGTHADITVTGIGTTRGRRLYSAVHQGSLGDDDNFRDARDALVAVAAYWSATGQKSFEATHVCSVQNAWAAVGIATSLADRDCDGITDNNDGDDDGDNTTDSYDNCPGLANPGQADFDGDGRGNDCDDDDDNDGVRDRDDNCPFVNNASQADADSDGIGNACDDSDGDGRLDTQDNCPTVSNWDQANTDGDSRGDVCDDDIDNDGHENSVDNCPYVVNANQADRDGDIVGDECDNCPSTENPDQQDCDNDGIGTACEENPDLEAIRCLDFYFEEEAVFVHPLDEVSLPHSIWERTDRVRPGDILELTVSGFSDPWVVVDHRGVVVARSESAGRSRTATWVPAADYHHEINGTRASFGTTYRLAISPDASPRGTSVNLTIEAKTR